MAGHSKWHNIKHRKAAQDAKKSKIYANIAKEIQMAAANWWDNPSMNPALDAVLTKARQAWLSKEVMKKAIDKWAGNDTGEELVEIFYEGYGPWWIAMYIKCITSNTNRSSWNVRAILTKYKGSLWAPGSVSRQFKERGEIFVTGKIKKEKVKWKEVEELLALDEEAFELCVMETAAEDYEIIEGNWRVITSREELINTVKHLESESWKVESSDFAYLAENEVSLDEEWEARLQVLIDALEEDEDVDTVWHNAG